MIKSISTALAVSAVAAFVGVCSQASAQNCSSCASTASSFSYPVASSSCGHHGCRLKNGHGHGHGHINEFKEQLHHQAAINSKIAARNDAWPKPFACWDKRGYYDTWNVMLNSGSETHAVLDSNFFTEANTLNRIGIDRVAGIVMNLPANERTVFVSRTTDQVVDQARVAAIQDMVATYYSHRGAVGVQLSDKIPRTAAAAEKLDIFNRRKEERPRTVLPVGEADTVNQAVTQ